MTVTSQRQKMLINKSENNIMVDIDGTLIEHLPPDQLDKAKRIVKLFDPISGSDITVAVNEPMVRLVMEEYHRGSCITVWSRGGWQWATDVIRSLELEPFVYEVRTKPLVYFDDVPVEEWLKYRVFLPSDTTYKG